MLVQKRHINQLFFSKKQKNAKNAAKPDCKGFVLLPSDYLNREAYGRKLAVFQPETWAPEMYEFATVKQALVDPCQRFCQDIMLWQMNENWDCNPEFLTGQGKVSILLREGAIDPRAYAVRKSAKSKTLKEAPKTKTRHQSPPPKLKKFPKASAAKSLIAQPPVEDGGRNKASPDIVLCEMSGQWS